jgi:hypothetical protein
MKKKLLLMILFAGSVISAQVPTFGLIGGWPFTGNANDMTANNNNGTAFGATLTTDRFSQPNCAYSFNGTSDYIVMLNAATTGTASRSVSFWAQTTNSVIQVAFNYGTPSAGGGIWQIVSNYNCVGYGFDQSTAAVIRGNPATIDGNWHHVVAIMNSSVGITVGSVQIYVDAVLQPSITCYVTSTVATINTNNSLPVTIGKNSAGSNRYFKGKLDDFYFYDRVLTPAEVVQLYNDAPCAGPPGTPSGINGISTICSGSAYVYSVAPVSGATSYTWTLPNGWTGTSSTNTISVTSNGTAGTMSVAAINGCGQSTFVGISIASNPSPTVTVTSEENIICKGNLVNLSASGANTYTWANGSVISQSISVSPTVTTTYTVTGTNAQGCTNTTIKTITVTNNTAPTILTSGTGSSCVGQTVSIAANGASTYTWQPGNLNGFLVTISPSVTTTYTVTGTDANGCNNSTVCTQTVIACGDMGVGEKRGDAGDLKIFPNPFNSSITVITPVGENVTIEVHNMLGSLIYFNNSNGGESQVTLSDKNSGIYFLSVKTSNGSSIHKIIKQ